MNDLSAGQDGLARCGWGTSTAEMCAYHDAEWGRPVADDQRVFEKLCLEGFQAGLSWLTILRKREAFREAFSGFDPVAVATFGARDIERLLKDVRIVRHRGKIEAAIANARATVELRDEGVSLAGLVWQHRPVKHPAPRRLADLAPSIPEAKALSGELRKRGFKFVGPTTVFAAMQALGLVNDHLVGCHWRRIAKDERAKFTVPSSRRS